MATLEDLTINVGADTDDVEKEVGGLSKFVDDNFAKITAAGVAAGGAMEAFARGQADVNAGLARTATNSDLTAGEIRNLAFELSDNTFAAEDAAAGMELLAQKGHNTGDEFASILPYAGNLADAVGKDLTGAINSADRLLAPFGQDLNDLGQESDQMARLISQTDVPLGTLERNLGRVPDELQALNFSLSDAAAGIEIFRDRGFSGQESVREFRRAVADSEGDMEMFLESIGLTSDEWARYQESVEPLPGLTDELADAHNDQVTPLQQLQTNVENLMFKYGGLADAASTLAPLLMALGPIAKGVTALKKGWTAAQVMLNKVLLANPIGLIIAAIAALIAIVVLIIKHWDTVKAAFQKAWSFIWDRLKAFGSWFQRTFWQGGLARVFGFIGDRLSWIRGIFSSAWTTIKNGGIGLLNWFRQIPSAIWSAFSQVWDIITSPFRSAFNAVAQFWNGTAGRLRFQVPGWVPGIGGKGWGMPKIPMMAEGGTIRVGGAAIVGEAGPELLDLPRGARVSPLDRASAGGSGTTVGFDFRGADQAFAAFFMKLLRTGKVRVG